MNNFDPFTPQSANALMEEYQRHLLDSVQRENEYLRMVLRTSHHSIEFKSKTWHALIDCMTLLLQCRHPNELLTHPNEQIRVLAKCFLEKDS